MQELDDIANEKAKGKISRTISHMLKHIWHFTPRLLEDSSDHIETAFCLAALADTVIPGKQQCNGILRERNLATDTERLLKGDFTALEARLNRISNHGAYLGATRGLIETT